MCAPPLAADPAANRLTITLLEGRTGLRLTGEAYLCTVPALNRAVAALPPGPLEIHLQLAGLEFIDVAAARLLVALTERPGLPEVILHYPPPFLIRMIRLLWPAALQRFSLRGAQLAPWPARGSTYPERQLPAGKGSRVPARVLSAAEPLAEVDAGIPPQVPSWMCPGTSMQVVSETLLAARYRQVRRIGPAGLRPPPVGGGEVRRAGPAPPAGDCDHGGSLSRVSGQQLGAGTSKRA